MFKRRPLPQLQNPISFARETREEVALDRALKSFEQQRPESAILVASVRRSPEHGIDVLLQANRTNAFLLAGLADTLLQLAIESADGARLGASSVRRFRKARKVLGFARVNPPSQGNPSTVDRERLLRERLQSIEDRIIGQRRWRIVAQTADGFFQWKPKDETPGQDSPERMSGEPFLEVERIILAHGLDEIVIAARRGHFRWKKNRGLADAMSGLSSAAAVGRPERRWFGRGRRR